MTERKELIENVREGKKITEELLNILDELDKKLEKSINRLKNL